MQAFDSNVINYLIKPINRQRLRSSIDIAIETIPKSLDIYENHTLLSDNTRFDMINSQYYIDEKIVELSKSESRLLELLCERKGIDVSSHDIFVSVWDDFDKEYSSDSVRTLVKKLRKKLPEGILKNVYGGFYKIDIK